MRTLINKILKSFGESMDSYGNTRLTFHNSLLDTNIEFEEYHQTNPKLFISK